MVPKIVQNVDVGLYTRQHYLQVDISTKSGFCMDWVSSVLYYDIFQANLGHAHSESTIIHLLVQFHPHFRAVRCVSLHSSTGRRFWILTFRSLPEAICIRVQVFNSEGNEMSPRYKLGRTKLWSQNRNWTSQHAPQHEFMCTLTPYKCAGSSFTGSTVHSRVQSIEFG